jgi:hypothetical protein
MDSPLIRMVYGHTDLIVGSLNFIIAGSMLTLFFYEFSKRKAKTAMVFMFFFLENALMGFAFIF